MIVAAVVAVVLVVSRDGDEQDAGAALVPVPALGWSEVASVLVPASPGTGPMRVGSETASGFSRDAGGAVVAAINISARIEAAAPRAVREATLREQCFGDVDSATLTASSSESSSGSRAVSDAPAGSTRALSYYYRVEGDPSADLVVVDVAAETGQSRTSGSYVHFRRTLRWVSGDWQMQVPVERAQPLPSLEGYAPLGRP